MAGECLLNLLFMQPTGFAKSANLAKFVHYERVKIKTCTHIPYSKAHFP